MSTVRIENLEKRFGDVEVLKRVSLTVPAHSLVTLLGPSGCGKTTLLRLVAGLERADGGTVAIGERAVSDPARGVHLPPAARRIGMVFQSYALWPHKRVWENVAHPLRVRKTPAAELRDRVQQALGVVQLAQLAERFPGELSGGQQQRVALARAIVYEPEVLLLDEPLSNLDAKLRTEMRYEIRELQQRSRLTTIYVTHDQEEAFVISDQICLMHGGVIEQLGSALDLYRTPRTRFVADFVGAANELPGTARSAGTEGNVAVAIADGWEFTAHCRHRFAAGDKLWLLVRPEDILLVPGGGTGASARVVQVTYLGGISEYVLDAGSFRLKARELSVPRLAAGDRVGVNAIRTFALPQ
ncbi:MAG TPA: ABC transporter ATP-binding protein [Burkholderiales bacterium]|jgi:iron(III) transport system ATP-binding protein|nr:ABC transporter ATP-binding protein [Burkholderiales bacterium]